MFVIKTDLKKQTVREVASVALQRSGLLMVFCFLLGSLVLCLFYWFGNMLLQSALMSIVSLAGMILVMYMLNRSTFIRLFEKQLQEKGNGEVCTVETQISGANVTQTTLTTGNTMNTSLNELMQATETKHYYVLLFQNRVIVVLDKSNVNGGSAEELKKHIEQYCPGHRKAEK